MRHFSDLQAGDGNTVEGAGAPLSDLRVGFRWRSGGLEITPVLGVLNWTGADYAAPTLGYFQWLLLREDYFQKMRELNQRGTLKDFHDRVYRIGFLPVVLVREALFHQLEEEPGP